MCVEKGTQSSKREEQEKGLLQNSVVHCQNDFRNNVVNQETKTVQTRNSGKKYKTNLHY